MFASASFSIYIGFFMLIFSPSERAVLECLVFSSFFSFMLTVSGPDWVRSLSISDVREMSERVRDRCAWMIFGPILDAMIFGILLACYAGILAALAEISEVLVFLAVLPGIFLVGKGGLGVRNDIVEGCRRAPRG